MDKLVLSDVSKRYGSTTVLHNVNLTVRQGEFLTLLGPSGSGKTTILKIVAGMIDASSGTIRIDGRDATAVESGKRDLGMVFQNYALMPHMSVFENVAFPLRIRKIKGEELKNRVTDALQKVRLEAFAARFPRELSGGQQQRVAIARAVVYNPSLILMDEPLGALDKKLREQLQEEIKRLHDELQITVIYVTHDQSEAMSMSDRIVLMNLGNIEQIDTPHGLYSKPKTRFAAEFLGQSNFFPIHAANGSSFSFPGCDRSLTLQHGASVDNSILMTRPEKIAFTRHKPDTADIRIRARALAKTFYGDLTVYQFASEGDEGRRIQVMRSNHSSDEEFSVGEAYYLSWNLHDSVVVEKSFSRTEV
ncbi:ABC transporter ATP-binding protein [Caballeronia sp. ATUFL_M1_KS5A]|uniref:ABC transporter ATP-binding protein n=1 Tax=Caballeronia sp. ATUFL_M1_KS5A TaxID=2921778 RepID=UPI0020294DA9|nr:ABC transporter ATP-binding protein [Caballeronia sp. ATUFL_M1_KS5A]